MSLEIHFQCRIYVPEEFGIGGYDIFVQFYYAIIVDVFVPKLLRDCTWSIRNIRGNSL